MASRQQGDWQMRDVDCRATFNVFNVGGAVSPVGLPLSTIRLCPSILVALSKGKKESANEQPAVKLDYSRDSWLVGWLIEVVLDNTNCERERCTHL